MYNEDMANQINPNLTDEQKYVCFLKGTEPPGSGKYNKFSEPGTYSCVNCGQVLFDADTKYDSGTGWPSFWKTTNKNVLKMQEDLSLGMHRTEILCSNCGAHLGHIFPDNRTESGEDYCVNSLALDFKPKNA